MATCLWSDTHNKSFESQELVVVVVLAGEVGVSANGKEKMLATEEDSSVVDVMVVAMIEVMNPSFLVSLSEDCIVHCDHPNIFL